MDPQTTFNIYTIEECEEHFEECCERRIEQFAETKDKLSILRSCIELLNRLEGTTHNLFAGRVLIFLARVIPFFDQSGVNLRSEFSVRDLPEFVKSSLKEISEQSAERDKHLSSLVEHDMEEGETLSDDESDDSTQQEDSSKIYERFWRAQQFLSQPNQLYDRNNWLSFRMFVDAIVFHFERKPTNCKIWKLKDSYMTEPTAFSLQLNDINMRRCFLVQVLIVLQYFDLPVETRPDNLALDKVQCCWLSAITHRIFSLLGNMPNPKEGREFLGLVTQVLKREEMWNKWKNEKCKEPKKPEEDEEEIINMGVTYHKRRKLSDELKSAKPYNMHVIGSQEMSKLWNKRPNQMRFNTPDLKKYFNIPPEKQIEKFKDPNASFRILRLLRKSPFFFVPAAQVIQSIDGYLKSLADKHFNVATTTTAVDGATK